MAQEEKFFTTGQFARAIGTTKDTLFHYDRIGLFSPDHIADNGYRYYSPRQFGTFTDIQNLKKLGIELSEIKNFLEGRGPAPYINLLESHIRATEQEILRLSDGLRDMQTALANAQEALSATDAITIERYPAVYGIMTQDPDEAFGGKFADFWRRLQESDLFTYNILCGVLPIAQIRAGNYEDYAYLYAQVNGDNQDGADIARPEGTYLVGYHFGHYDTIGQTYQRMLKYAHAQGLQPGEFAYEEYLLYDMAVQETSQMVTKLLLPIVSHKGV